jgi:FKBP12-rapamycin complex-associated protein
LKNLSEATRYDRNWYKAWHAWALANFEVLSFYDSNEEPSTIADDKLTAYAIPAIQGFFKSISLSKGNFIQDTLRLLTLWFRYGHQSDVNMAIGEGFNTVSIDTWLSVIPQVRVCKNGGADVSSLLVFIRRVSKYVG